MAMKIKTGFIKKEVNVKKDKFWKSNALAKANKFFFSTKMNTKSK